RIGYATSTDGIVWTNYEGNPVLDVGVPGAWDDYHVFGPSVLFDDGTYKMWYTGYDGSNYRIGYATSTDGIVWTKYANNPVLDLGASGAWDDVHVYTPSVLFEDGTYKMWYTGYDGSHSRIGYAISTDGIDWDKYEGNPVLNLGAPGAWDDSDVYTPSVLFDDGTYKMWNIGYDGSNWRIGYATSDDGIFWDKYEGNPVLDLGAPGEWDDYSVSFLSVLFEDGTYKMWYSGHDGSNYRIGYATSGATSSATIAIRTDKLTYHKGDPMTVYADVVNIDDYVPDAVLALYLVRVPWVLPVQIIPFEMPANFESYDWEVFTIDSLPSLRRRSYAYLGVLASQSEGILAADIAFWTFSSSLSDAEAARLRKVAEEYLWNLDVADLK
ncbi:hypothetical protein H8E77_41865, partial [bacterium]|nr:hypothetical protein [bacterium]